MRLNIFGAPGSGKSKLAYWLCDVLAREGVVVELVQEVIKPDAYRGEQPTSWGSFTVFARQLRRELRWLEAGVPHLVSDSPLWLQAFYQSDAGLPCAAGVRALARAFDADWPQANVFLRRSTAWPYQAAGRYHDAAASDGVARRLADFLKAEGVTAFEYDAGRRLEILAFVQDRLRRDRRAAVPPPTPACAEA